MTGKRHPLLRKVERMTQGTIALSALPLCGEDHRAHSPWNYAKAYRKEGGDTG